MRLAFLDDYQRVAESARDWSSIDPDLRVVSLDQHLDGDDLVEALRGVEIVVAMRERTALDATVLARLPELRLIVTTGMSNAAIDVVAASGQNIVVSGTGGYLAPTIELTWGLILAVARQIPANDRLVRAGRWQQYIGTELVGKTLGIIGLGRTGSGVARIGQAFGMRCIAWSENLTDGRARDCGVRRVEKDQLLEESDVVTIHLVSSPRTRGLIGREELALMKCSAYLINTSRAEIVQTEPLMQALAEGEIAGAGLDVFDREPLMELDARLDCPSVVLTPHIGYVTDDLYRQFYAEIYENIKAWRDGDPIRVIDAMQDIDQTISPSATRSNFKEVRP